MRSTRLLGGILAVAAVLSMSTAVPAVPKMPAAPSAEEIALEQRVDELNLEYTRASPIVGTLDRAQALAARVGIPGPLVVDNTIPWMAAVRHAEPTVIVLTTRALALDEVAFTRILAHEHMHRLQMKYGMSSDFIEDVLADASPNLSDDPDRVWAGREGSASCMDQQDSVYRPKLEDACTPETLRVIAEWLRDLDSIETATGSGPGTQFENLFPFLAVGALVDDGRGGFRGSTYTELSRLSPPLPSQGTW